MWPVSTTFDYLNATCNLIGENKNWGNSETWFFHKRVLARSTTQVKLFDPCHMWHGPCDLRTLFKSVSARHWVFNHLSQIHNWNSQKRFVLEFKQRSNQYIWKVWEHDKNQMICKAFTWTRLSQFWKNCAILIRNKVQQIKCWKIANIRPPAQPTGYPNGLITRKNLVLVSHPKIIESTLTYWFQRLRSQR